MKTIATNNLFPDKRNANVCTPEVLAKLKRNIQRQGYYPAVLVRPHPKEEGHYVIIDGHHRVEVLKDLGHTEVQCQVFDVDEKQAAILLATLNTLRGTDHLQKRAELIESLTTFMPLNELALLLPETNAQIDDLLKLARLDLSEIENSLKASIEKEQQSLPVPLSFLVSQEEAEMITKTLHRFHSQDRGIALVALCEFSMKHLKGEESSYEKEETQKN